MSSERVAVIVPTRARPNELRACLGSLVRQTRRPDLVVVVNTGASVDAGSHARNLTLVSAMSKAHDLHFEAVNAEVTGYSNARNIALDWLEAESSEMGLRWAAFIDDDELATPTWLEDLLVQAAVTGAALVSGPVITTTAKEDVSAWLDTWAGLGGARWPEPSKLPTNNLLVDLDAWRAVGCTRFDGRFNDLGGEDTVWTSQLQDLGLTASVAYEATVYAPLAASRVTFSYQASRAVANGRSLTVQQMRSGQSRGLVLVSALARLLSGLPLATIAVGRRRDWTIGVKRSLRGWGELLQAIGI